MRRFPGHVGSRAESDRPFTSLSSMGQMSYIIADEASIDCMAVPPRLHPVAGLPPRLNSKKVHVAAADQANPRYDVDKDGSAKRPRSPREAVDPRRCEPYDEEHVSRPSSLKESAASRPLTPVLLAAITSGPASCALSSLSSRSMSSDGLSNDGSAQDSDESPPREPARSGMVDSGSAPQLIMPSIKMPSRRPFTDEGKRLGRLKVMVAGASGVGKTSLVKAIVQSCEHIVHVDPIVPATSSSLVGPAGHKSRSRLETDMEMGLGSGLVTEIYASTKPYPDWWSEIDDLRILRGRKSLGDVVLDRNICFVDTPGHRSGHSVPASVTRYLESHFQRVGSAAIADGEMLSLLGGEGGVLVDAVIYLISNRLQAVDIQYMRRIAAFTNIIPVLTQSDLLSQEQIIATKSQIASQLMEANIQIFSFGTAVNLATTPDPTKTRPWAVSSATGSDDENMDASLLMSPEYVRPLVPTELAALVKQVFCQAGASRLRHSAAKKYIRWRDHAVPSRPTSSSQRSFSMAGSRPGGRVFTSSMRPTGSYALARFADHTQREERVAQVRIANWAIDLQRSLEKERAEYEALACSERAVWLTERLGECVQDGTLVPIRKRAPSRSNRHGRGENPTGRHHDPLGLLEVANDMWRRATFALELLGGVSVLGGLVWLSRSHGCMLGFDWLIGEGQRLWYGR